MATILLVEDDRFLSSLLKNRLQKDAFEVETAMSGTEALEKLKTLRPDIVLLDIILPGKSGFEILEEIKSDPQIQNTPVIIISNLGQEGDVERMMKMGAKDYFVKARTSIEDIVKKVRNYLPEGSGVAPPVQPPLQSASPSESVPSLESQSPPQTPPQTPQQPPQPEV
ncbi:MAG: response regulator [Candidatus Harrisonbacteria bacterium CG10_big_fil_rev_8_21_14_0_10_42_17]|uniref:Response regulator n=1 Tax=Candidatus Harrisonbacteria bacterium CG10_big_fil_rev_8_21_14_0_10_42_17 TaxID=1974584 RepID=A0A2M6WIJ4_9BACT|nr:MAG: response regulator [Candidatus Harrisonbacteria bacterium CG10_big_fil_rev_8_21_14_0_10_42_17]